MTAKRRYVELGSKVPHVFEQDGSRLALTWRPITKDTIDPNIREYAPGSYAVADFASRPDDPVVYFVRGRA